MKKQSSSRYILLVAILLITTIYSYLFLITPEVILFSFVVFIPVAIYALKYGIDIHLISCQLAVAAVIYMLYGIGDFITCSMLILLPSFFISYLMRQKASLSRSTALLSVLLFVCCLGAITMLNYVNKVDILANYFDFINQFEIEFFNVYGGLITSTANSIEEYTIAMEAFKNTFRFMRYYYPALLYMLFMGISFVSVLGIRIVAHYFKLFRFDPKNIINYKVPRTMIVFLIIIVCMKAFNASGTSYLFIAVDNVLVILMIMLFIFGILFELFMIRRIEKVGQRMLLIIMSIFCLIFFQMYFVLAGFIDGVFQIRRKLNNA